jgi:hypothetical protein
VAAAQLRRENALHIMFVEILPNVMPPILVETTVRLGYAIFQVATLSFIGFGIQPPSPDWGLSISSNYGLIGAGYWWTVLFDGFSIASLVVAVNLVADGIQGALDVGARPCVREGVDSPIRCVADRLSFATCQQSDGEPRTGWGSGCGKSARWRPSLPARNGESCAVIPIAGPRTWRGELRAAPPA